MTTILSDKFHNKVPVMLEDISGDLLKLKKSKFLLDKEITLGQFMCIIRKKNTIEPNEAIYVFCDNVLPKSNTSMIDLWNEHHKSDDNILHLTCSKENTFG